jgi:hypothetical protein
MTCTLDTLTRLIATLNKSSFSAELVAGAVRCIGKPQPRDGKSGRRRLRSRVLRNARDLRADSRSPQLPDVPATVESGLPKLQVTFWSGVLATAGTPASIIGKLNAALNEEMRSKDIDAVLVKLSAKPKLGTPQDFATFMWGRRGTGPR